MKSFGTIILAFVVAVIASYATLKFGTSPNPSETAIYNSDKQSVYERVMRTGEIRCGYGVWDPYIIYDFEAQKPTGIAIDLIEAIAAKLNLKLIWPEETGWANLPTALENGRVDLACATLWNDPARSRLVAFSDPLFYQEVSAFIRDDSDIKITRRDDLNDPRFRFSVQDGGFENAIVDRLFPKAQKISLHQMNQASDLFVQVASGKADIMISNPAAVQAYNAANPDKRLVHLKLDKPLAIYGNSYAVNIHEQELLGMFNTVVRNMIQTGEIEELLADFRAKYPGEILLPAKPYKVTE